MPTAVTRALLQVIYLEQRPSPRTPNALSDLLGPIRFRSAGGESPRGRGTIDIRGAADLRDNPARNAVEVNVAGDVVAQASVSGALNDYRDSLTDDASIVAFNCASAAALSGLDAFRCNRLEKLIINVGSSNALTVLHNSTLSVVPDNRILTDDGGDLVIAPGGAAWLVRDFVSVRWRAKFIAAPEVPPVSDDGYIYTGPDGELTPLGM